MAEIFLNYEFAFIFLFFCLFFFVLAVIVKNKAAKLISLFLFPVFFALGTSEFILSFTVLRGHFNSYNTDILDKGMFLNRIRKINETCVSDRRGNKLFAKNNKYAGELLNNKAFSKIYSASYSVFDNGLRYTRCNDKSDEIYVFLGCSFTFGAGVNDDETLPYYFSELAGFKYNVINCGLISKGTNTALNIVKNEIIYKKTDSSAHVKRFVYSLIEGHVDRNFCLDDFRANDNWLCERRKWERVSQPFGTVKLLFSSSYIFRKIFLPLIDKRNNNYYTRYLIDSLYRINEIVAKKYNSRLTLIVWPDCGRNEQLFKWLKEVKNIDVLFLPDYISSIRSGYVLADSHPTPKANKEIAQILYNHIVIKQKRDKNGYR